VQLEEYRIKAITFLEGKDFAKKSEKSARRASALLTG
jgi:hypothetical protein